MKIKLKTQPGMKYNYNYDLRIMKISEAISSFNQTQSYVTF